MQFPLRQDLPGFPPHAPCFSLFPPQHTPTQSLSPRLSPLIHSTYFFLSPQSLPVCLFLLCLLVPICFTFFTIPSLAPSMLYIHTSNAASLSYYTTLLMTFISPSSPFPCMSFFLFLHLPSPTTNPLFSSFLLLHPIIRLCLTYITLHAPFPHFSLSLPPSVCVLVFSQLVRLLQRTCRTFLPAVMM